MQNKTVASVEQDVQSMQAQLQEALLHKGFYWRLHGLLEATQGCLTGPVCNPLEVRFTSVSTDTRTLQAGALYIAIKGPNFDGHEFIAQAVQQGAVAVLHSAPRDARSDWVVPGVEVTDTRLALGEFARWHRRQIALKKLIAITGSNGKTSTKTLLTQIFSQAGQVLATEGNLNNDLGVPRTLLQLRPEHDYAIIEMGANHQNEIRYLTHLAQPDVALVNNASSAHLEGFGSLEGVVQAKGEIYEGLDKQTGLAMVNIDSPGSDQWLNKLQGYSQVVTFASQGQADFKMQQLQTLATEHQLSFEIVHQQQNNLLTLPVLGEHNAMNATAAAAIAISVGLSWAQVKQGCRNYTGVPGRLALHKLRHGWLMDDSYNANPASVKAGIDALVELPGVKVLCLGAMAELGEESAAAHEDIAQYAKQKGVQALFLYGQATAVMPAKFTHEAFYFADHQALNEALETYIKSNLHRIQDHTQGINVLVKGSRSAHMEQVVEHLLSKFKEAQ